MGRPVVSAPMTRTCDTLVAPSASSTICSASEVHACVKRGGQFFERGVAASPLAKTSTVSLVDVQPSTVMELNERLDGGASRPRAASRDRPPRRWCTAPTSWPCWAPAWRRPWPWPPTVNPLPCDEAFLGHGVGRHDGPRRRRTRLERRGARRHDAGQVRFGLGQGEWNADQPGLADQDFFGRAPMPAATAAHRPQSRQRGRAAPVAALALPDVKMTRGGHRQPPDGPG